MNQSGKNKKELLAMPGKFDISVPMDKAIKKAEDELRMLLGSTSIINQSERALLSKLAKEQKKSDEKEQKDSR